MYKVGNVRNYLNNVAKGKRINGPILFQGGVAYNIGIRSAFEKELNQKLVIPENFNVMGAIGSAILAKETIEISNKKSTFKGLDILIGDLKISKKDCTDCSNKCELTEIVIGNSAVSFTGDHCGKWQV
jgi:predicted NodU family carbamoyl transferase